MERFLRGRHVAVLTTTNADGTPLQTPVWYHYDGGVIYVRTNAKSAKCRNIQRDSRVSMCVQDERPPYQGVTVTGGAEITPDRPDLSKAMSRNYLGAIAGFFYLRLRTRNQIEGDPDTILVIRPERKHGWDYRPQTPLAGRVWLALKRLLPAPL
ncbi:MAG: PPOX class F420-dependent oxidoreductase [Dehalococcoidia bacterium]